MIKYSPLNDDIKAMCIKCIKSGKNDNTTKEASTAMINACTAYYCPLWDVRPQVAGQNRIEAV